MGGKAFTSTPHALSVPRLPPPLYQSLKAKYLALLSQFYAHAAVPLEAPEKGNYGDIDILVSVPLTSGAGPDALATTLEAKAVVRSGPLTSFAVPYPGSDGSYVQLDIHECPPETFRWQLFHESNGDLWNMLGTTLRPFGLTANDVGFHARVPEIEHEDRKKSFVLLTTEPDAVLTFLGLDAQMYWTGFETVEGLWRYVCGCRFVTPGAYRRGDLKANDRKRMGQREGYRRFVEEWVPRMERERKDRESKEGGGMHDEGVTREGVLEDALEVFGKSTEYEGRVDMWRKERAELARKREEKQERRARALEDEVYADAWKSCLEER